MNKVRTRIVNITPEYATQLLQKEHEGQLRRRTEKHVQNLARIMSEGNWQDLNGDTIVIDTDGNVIDGQHRLLAVIESKKVIVTLLVEGVRPEAYYSIDLQAKSRGLRDVLSIEGYVNCSSLSTTLRSVWFFRRDIGGKGSRILPAIQDLVRLLNSDIEGFVNAVKATHGTQSILACGQAAFLYYLFAEINVDDAKRFFKFLVTGVGFSEDNAIRLLRDRLMADYYSKSKLPKVEKLGLCIVAWNAFRTGKRVRQLRWKRHDGNKLPLPL